LLKSKAELEKEINETRYFALTRDDAASARETEKAKLFLAVLSYCRNYWYASPGKWNKNYGEIEGEVYETFIACLKPGVFDPNAGTPFLKYLKTSIYNLKVKVLSKEGKIQKNEKSDCDYKSQLGADSEDCFSIIDTIESPEYNKEASDAVASEQNVRDILNVIDEKFRNKQERVKPYLRTLLTLQHFQAIGSIENFPRDYECIDYAFLDTYKNELELPAQKEVAASFGKSETDASRTLGGFNELIIPEIKKLAQEKDISFSFEKNKKN
jgi:hypothetical protein